MKRVDGAVLTGLMCSFISVKKGGKATVRNKIVTLSSLFLLFSIAVFGQEHRARVIDYISCDNDIPGVKETDGRVVNRKWEATFNGEIGFHHVRGNDQTEDKDHDSDRLRYLTYDGACFEARWDSKEQKFVHTSVSNPREVRKANRLDYLTWDLSKWSARRDGDEFVHTFIGGKDNACSTFLGIKWGCLNIRLGPGWPQPVSTPAIPSVPASAPIVSYTDPSWCILTPFSSNMYLTLYEEAKSGGKGVLIWKEFLLKRGYEIRVDTHGKRLVFDYRYSQGDGLTSNVHTWCYDGKRQTIP